MSMIDGRQNFLLLLSHSVSFAHKFSTDFVRKILSDIAIINDKHKNEKLVDLVAGTIFLIPTAFVWHKFLKPILKDLYNGLFSPLNRIVDLETSDEKKIRMRKRMGDFPPVYPNGWFKICNSWDLKPGQVLQKSALGLDLAVFRADDGSNKVYALDLYCPHLGANLAVGGRVCGGDLVCPFHRWAFAGDDGRCVSNGNVPVSMPMLNDKGSYEGDIELELETRDHTPKCTGTADCHDENASPSFSKPKFPPQANTKSYYIVERHQMVWIWHHAEGIAPTWDLFEMPTELTSTHGKTQHHVYCHIQEIPENGPDAAHLNVVHLDLEHTNQWIRNIWAASWRVGNEADGGKHQSIFRVQHVSTVLNWFKIPYSEVDVNGRQIGPGIVYFDFLTPLGKFAMVQTVTPVGPLHQEIEHVIFTPSWFPCSLGKWFMIMMTATLEQDVPIWNNKTYLSRPTVVKNDGPILQFRRWFSQFYSEHSVTLEQCRNESLDW